MNEHKGVNQAVNKVVNHNTIITIARRVENLKFTGMISEFSKFCEGYNEAIDHVLEVILKELQQEMEAGHRREKGAVMKVRV